MKLSACVSVAALLAAGALPPVAIAQQVGTVAAVNRDMTGTPPGQTRRELALGLDVIRDERVETTDVGSGQLMFLDQTTLTVSPNTDIVLDEYVYDPGTGTSDLALSVTRGALRFIGGRITKAGPAIVRTPTATVGIRGGLAVIDIRDDGVTEVIHLAGENTTVSQCGDADGNGVDDGCAPAAALSRVVLSRPNASAEANPTGVTYTGLADASRLAGIYGKLEGQGQGGIDSAPSDDAVSGGTQQVASVNSEIPGGEHNSPVSTSGEQQAAPSGQSEESSGPTTVVQNSDPDVGGQPDETDAPVVVEPVEQIVPAGGAAFATNPAVGFQPFDTVEVGSLLGIAGDEVFTIPVPGSSDLLLEVHPEGAEFTPFAISRHPGAGLFTFDPETASSTTLGGLRGEFGPIGVGFADFDNVFVFVPFVTGPDSGIVMFGNPTPGQGRFFPNDPDVTGARTVDAYRNEFGLDLNRSFLVLGGDGRNPAPQDLFLVGTSGEPRFVESQVQNAPPLPGRAVSATLDVTDEDGFRRERLGIFVSPLRSTPDSLAPEMTIAGRGFVTVTDTSNFFDGEVFVRETEFGFGRPAYGTFEDLRGHTLFGPEGEYFVLSSVHRAPGGGLATDDFGTDLVRLDEQAPGGSFGFLQGDFRASLFTRDPGGAEIIEEPLPLAGQPAGPFGSVDSLDGGFAAAIAICSSGNCGDRSDGFGEPDFAGGYPLFSAPRPGGTTVSFNGDDPGLSFTFVMADNDAFDDDASNIAFAGENPDAFVFRVDEAANGPMADAWGAYLDDRRFAAAGSGPQVIAGNVQQGVVGMASSGLAGHPDGLFPAGTDATPEFLRWGYWSATYQVTDGTTGQTRTDLVPVGTFVAGNTPDPQDIPFAGSASYSGFAVATAADLTARETRTIGGDFTMNYDFGQSRGDIQINLPTFAVPHVTLDVFGGETNFYEGSIASELPGGLEADVRGAFFAGGGDPVAATAGNFAIEQGDAFAIGVYGGTSSGLQPGLPPTATLVQN